MNKESRQSMAARMARSRSTANDDELVRDQIRDQINDTTPMASAETEAGAAVWTARLVIFLRVMAVLSMAKGLYHWAEITGFIGGEDAAFENQTTQWQSATVYFAVIQLVAAVGLWLATPWGAVVWLTTIVSQAVIELMFPAVYGGNMIVLLIALLLLGAYLALAWMAARERPP
jgi:zona occludens toxin (predicted ATPase)